MREARHWVGNVDARVQRISAGGASVPLLLDGPRAGASSYVAGARAAWLDYAAHEARRGLPGAAGLAAGAGLALGLPPLRAAFALAGLSRAAWIDAPLFSTQLPDPALADAAPALAAAARAAAPDRLLLWRNLCPEAEPRLPAALRADGWALLPARLVYLCDPADAALWKRGHVKRDQALLREGSVAWVEPGEVREADLPALRACFRAVFIDKHSALNPDYTDAFFLEALRAGGPLELLGLRWEGRIVGVLGLYARHGWLTTPLIGYDTSAPAALGLYRRLMARLLREARERGLRLHYSSGAGDFKRHRGGVPALEYTAADPRGLAWPRRAAFAAIASALQRAAPALLARHG